MATFKRKASQQHTELNKRSKADFSQPHFHAHEQAVNARSIVDDRPWSTFDVFDSQDVSLGVTQTDWPFTPYVAYSAYEFNTNESAIQGVGLGNDWQLQSEYYGQQTVSGTSYFADNKTPGDILAIIGNQNIYDNFQSQDFLAGNQVDFLQQHQNNFSFENTMLDKKCADNGSGTSLWIDLNHVSSTPSMFENFFPGSSKARRGLPFEENLNIGGPQLLSDVPQNHETGYGLFERQMNNTSFDSGLPQIDCGFSLHVDYSNQYSDLPHHPHVVDSRQTNVSSNLDVQQFGTNDFSGYLIPTGPLSPGTLDGCHSPRTRYPLAKVNLVEAEDSSRASKGQQTTMITTRPTVSLELSHIEGGAQSLAQSPATINLDSPPAALRAIALPKTVMKDTNLQIRNGKYSKALQDFSGDKPHLFDNGSTTQMIQLKPQGLELQIIECGGNAEQKIKRPRGRRDGSLKERQKAANVRGLEAGSCWPCRISRKGCSYEAPCKECILRYDQGQTLWLRGRICPRLVLGNFAEDFFPSPAARHYRIDVISQLIVDKVHHFTDNLIPAEVRCGSDFPVLRLPAYEYAASDVDFLTIPRLQIRRKNVANGFTSSFAPAIGLKSTKAAAAELETLCKANIKEMITSAHKPIKVDTGQFSWELYRIIQRHAYAGQGNKTLETALKMYNMQFFMSKSLTFSKQCADQIILGLQNPHRHNYCSTTTSRLLAKQIKECMNRLLSESITDVLNSLQATLMKHERENWITEVFTICLLCMTAEIVQTTTDLQVVQRMQEFTRDAGTEFCQILEENISGALFNIFHGMRRTSVDTRKRETFNPIKNGLTYYNSKVDLEDSFTPQECQVVDNVRSLIRKHRTILEKQDKQLGLPRSTDESKCFQDHLKFREKNVNRLLIKFILSFPMD